MIKGNHHIISQIQTPQWVHCFKAASQVTVTNKLSNICKNKP